MCVSELFTLYVSSACDKVCKMFDHLHVNLIRRSRYPMDSVFLHYLPP